MPVGLPKIFAFERAIDGLLALGSAADAADLSINSRTKSPGLAGPAYGAIHVSQYIEREPNMRTNVFIKVVVEHDAKEKPEKLGAELCRQLEKNYLVRSAEVSNLAPVDE
jgi:hypothetical protein